MMEAGSSGKVSPSFKKSFHGKADEWGGIFKVEVLQRKVFWKIFNYKLSLKNQSQPLSGARNTMFELHFHTVFEMHLALKQM